MTAWNVLASDDVACSSTSRRGLKHVPDVSTLHRRRRLLINEQAWVETTNVSRKAMRRCRLLINGQAWVETPAPRSTTPHP